MRLKGRDTATYSGFSMVFTGILRGHLLLLTVRAPCFTNNGKADICLQILPKEIGGT